MVVMMMTMVMMMMMDKAPPSPCPPGHCKRPSCASQRSPHRPYVRDAPAMAPRGRTPSVCGDHPVYNRIRHPDCSMNLITPQSSKSQIPVQSLPSHAAASHDRFLCRLGPLPWLLREFLAWFKFAACCTGISSQGALPGYSTDG